MPPIPPRVIAQIWTSKALSPERIADLRARISRDLEAQGRALIDLIIDRESPKEDAGDHDSLQRIARGDADGIMLMRLPVSIGGKKSRDVLFKHLDGPIRFFNAAELAELGLLPGGTKYKPHRTLADAAQFASPLRSIGLSLRAIASRLDAEGFCTPRDGTWHAATVAQLLESGESDQGQTLPEVHADSPAP